MAGKCTRPKCRNDEADLGLCRRHLKESHEAKAVEVESSPVGPSVDREYHARAAFRHVEATRGEPGRGEFTRAYRELAERGRVIERDDPIVADQSEDVAT